MIAAAQARLVGGGEHEESSEMGWLPPPLGVGAVCQRGDARSHTRATASQTFTINVDGTPKNANEGFDAYFPRAITIHAGRHGAFPLGREGRAAHDDVRHARQQRRATSTTTSRRRSRTRTRRRRRCSRPMRALPQPLPAGAGRCGPVGRESLLPAERQRGLERLPELAARAARLQRDAGLLQQRLARLGAELVDPLLQLDLAGHVPLHVRCCTARACRERSRSRPASKTIMSPAAQYALGREAAREGCRAARPGACRRRGRARRRSRA